MALFDVHNLTKTYQSDGVDTTVLHEVSFSIERGEFVSIMGPSGSGKSTLLHILGFLDEHTSGSYHFNGKSFKDHTDDEIAQVRNSEMGFVFQAFNLLPRETVYGNVRLPLLYSDIPEREWDKRVRDGVEIVDMSHRLDFEASRLSGGEKQRTAIARALVAKPDVIFADEPTGNLDSKSGQAVMETLQSLHDDHGHTVILITHETYTAEHADRLIYIQDGRIAKDSKVDKRRNARDAFVK